MGVSFTLWEIPLESWDAYKHSYVSTIEQHGVVEHKYHHVLNVARSLRFQ